MMEEKELLVGGCVSLMKHVLGDENWSRWGRVRGRSRFSNSQQFVTWLLDLAEDELDRHDVSLANVYGEKVEYVENAVHPNATPDVLEDSSSQLEPDHTQASAAAAGVSGHSGDEVLEPQTAVCNMESTNLIHVAYNHTSSCFYCNICAVSLSDLEIVKQHMAMRHSGEHFQIDCSCCDQQFSSAEEYVNVHAMTLMMTSKSHHICQFCAKSFAHKSNLDSHIVVKHQKAEPAFSCVACEKKFRYSSGLSAHKKRCKFVGMQQSILP